MKRSLIFGWIIIAIAFCYGCSKKQTISESKPTESEANEQTNDFTKRQPFKFTIDTYSKNDRNEDIKISISINKLDGQYPVLYDFDCESDGEYEFSGVSGDHECLYKPNTGKHQISVRGNISAIKLCDDDSDSGEAVISVDNWGDFRWKNMSYFAHKCKNLIKLPQDAPNLSEVTDMSNMFKDSYSFNQPLEKWNVSNVTNMHSMFLHAESFNQPLEKWNVSNVADMSWMFEGALSFNQPLEKWNVSNVTNMNMMFGDAESFNQPLCDEYEFDV